MTKVRAFFQSIPFPALSLAWIVAVLAWFELRTWPDLVAAVVEMAAPIRWAGLSGFVDTWAGRLAGLAVFLVLQVACWGAGSVVAGFLRMRPRILRDLPLGWLILGTAVAAIGLSGLAFPVVLAFLVVASLLAVRWQAFRGLKGANISGISGWGAVYGLPVFSVVISIVVLAVVLVCALAPETAGDPLTCHYANPLRILGLHRMTAWPFTIHDDYPFLYESLLLPLFAFAGEPAVRWFNPFLLAFISIAVYRSGTRFMGRGWAAFGAALVATSPFLASQAVVAKNDLLVAAFGFAAIESVAISRSARSILSAGLLCGGAFAVKYNGAYLVPALAVAILFTGGVPLGRLAFLLPGAFLGAIPVMAKNFLFTGDPLYPFLGALFVGPFSSPVSRIRMREHLYVVTLQNSSSIGPGMVLKSLVGGGIHPDESLGRWFLLLPALAFMRRISVEGRIHLLAQGVLLVAWAAGPPQARYATAIFPSGCLLAAYGLSMLASRGSITVAVMAGFLLMAQAVHATVSLSNARMLKAGLGLEDSGAYRLRRLGPGWEAVLAVERESPPARRVLLHGENRSALFKVPSDFAAFGGPAFPPFEALQESWTTEDVWKKFRQRGWTHLVYNRLSAFFWSRSLADDPWTQRELVLWAAFWDRHSELVFESPTMDLERGYFYAFRFVGAPRIHFRGVLPGIEGWVWRMEQARAVGNRVELSVLLASLRKAAGSYGITDRVEADMAGSGETRERVRALLNRAVTRGFQSPPVFLSLARMAAEDGDLAGAAKWKGRAEKLEQGSSRR